MSTNEVISIDIEENKISQTIEGFLDLVEEVPWGNSDWQNHHAIVNMELTAERAYRHASLRIMNRLQALQECYYSIKKDEIQIERHKRKATAGDDLDKREAEIEIDQILSRRAYTKKLIGDAIGEIKSLAPVIQKIGHLSRQQFEAAEEQHFIKVYKNQILGKPEALVALESLGIDFKTEEKNSPTLFERIVDSEEKQLS